MSPFLDWYWLRLMNDNESPDGNYMLSLHHKVREKYPAHEGEARKLISRFLRHYDKNRWLAFNGEMPEKKYKLLELSQVHMYMASLLECRDRGHPVTDLYLETALRICLDLPFGVIQGGQQE